MNIKAEQDECGYCLYDDDYVPDGRINPVQVMIGAHTKELIEHYAGRKVNYTNKYFRIYFSTEDEANKAIQFLESQLVAWRLIGSK